MNGDEIQPAQVHGEQPTGKVVEVSWEEAEPFLRAEILGHGKTEEETEYVLIWTKRLVDQGRAVMSMDEASKVYVGVGFNKREEQL